MGTTQSANVKCVTENDEYEHFDTMGMDEGDFDSVLSQDSIVPRPEQEKKEIENAKNFLKGANVPINDKQSKLDAIKELLDEHESLH